MRFYLLDQACELLRDIGVVNNRSEFCTDWLGQSECYLRTLNFKKSEPSLGVMAICASRLQKAGEQMMSSPRYRHYGHRFILLSEKCHAEVNAESVELDLDLTA